MIIKAQASKQRWASHIVADCRGVALFTMAFILATIAGSYAYFNSGVSKTDRQIFATGQKKLSAGQLIGQNIVNRLLNVMRNADDLQCADGSATIADNGKDLTNFINTYAKKFKDTSGDSDNESQVYALSICAPPEDGQPPNEACNKSDSADGTGTEISINDTSSQKIINCLTTETERQNLTDLYINLQIHGFTGQHNIIDIGVKGKARLRTDDTLALTFEATAQTIIHPASIATLGFVFHNPKTPLITVNSDGKVIFATSVFIHQNTASKTISELSDILKEQTGSTLWNKSAVFKNPVLTNTSTVDLSALNNKGLDNFSGVFQKGLHTKFLTNESDKLTTFLDSFSLNLGGRSCYSDNSSGESGFRYESNTIKITGNRSCEDPSIPVVWIKQGGITIDFSGYSEGSGPMNFCALLATDGTITITGAEKDRNVFLFGSFMASQLKVDHDAKTTIYSMESEDTPSDLKSIESRLMGHFHADAFTRAITEDPLNMEENNGNESRKCEKAASQQPPPTNPNTPVYIIR
ncbi:MAG: hypothetical protein OXC44_06570 [Proteobacteria bacterium]|nr:hypothetical protein [Pseudomonadota bacterium]